MASADAFIKAHTGSDRIEEIIKLNENSIAVTYKSEDTEVIVQEALLQNGIFVRAFSSVDAIKYAFKIQ